MLVDNDVNLMALGEHATVYPDVQHLIFVKVATGIGAGIISGGRLHRGAQGAAGDLGHVAALHGGDTPCTCGNVGCLEAVASGPAIVRALARERNRRRSTAAASIRLAQAGRPRRSRGRARGRPRDRARPRDLRQPAQPVGHRRRRPAGPVGREPAGRHPRGRLRPLLPLATGELQIVASRTGGQAGVIGAATMVIQHVLSVDQVEHQLAGATAV